MSLILAAKYSWYELNFPLRTSIGEVFSIDLNSHGAPEEASKVSTRSKQR